VNIKAQFCWLVTIELLDQLCNSNFCAATRRNFAALKGLQFPNEKEVRARERNCPQMPYANQQEADKKPSYLLVRFKAKASKAKQGGSKVN